MNKNIKIVVLASMSVFLITEVQAMMQEVQERSLREQEKVMARLFPQTEMTVLAADALTSPHARNKYFWELILRAIIHKNVEQVQNILKQGLRQGFDVNFKDALGSTLLHEAAFYDNTLFCQVLIEAGADINSSDIEGNTPLHYAAVCNEPETVRQLIEAGADVNAKNKFNRTPLEHAVKCGSVAVVQLLLKTPGVNIDREELLKALATSIAPSIKQELDKILAPHLMTLVDLSADIVAKNRDKNCIKGKQDLLPQELQEKVSDYLFQRVIDNELLEALKTRDIPVALAALEQGARVHVQDKDGSTPLHLASRIDSANTPGLIKALLARGADINKTTGNGMSRGNFTPLHESVLHGDDPEVLTLLLENGVHVNAETSAGYTSLDYAVLRKYREAVTILLRYGAVHGRGLKNHIKSK